MIYNESIIPMYSDRLKELREEKKLKQIQICEILQLKNKAYSMYETEYKIIPLKHLVKLCDYFEVSLDYIFNFVNTKNYSNTTKGINKEKVAIRIKEVRKSKKIVQLELAKILNIASGTIGEIERGNLLISTHSLYTFCKKYEVSADYLLGRIECFDEFKKNLKKKSK